MPPPLRSTAATSLSTARSTARSQGAVFKGEGHIHITPPNAEERHNLSIVTHSDQVDEDFDQVVLRFTDNTAVELHKTSAGAGQASNGYASAAMEFHNFMRTKLKDNLDLRLLQDVLSPAPGGFFIAAIHGKKDSHILFTLDPHGDGGLAPEEVSLLVYNDWGPSWPTAFHQASDIARGDAKGPENNAACRIDNEQLDVTIERSGLLSGQATVHLIALQDGAAVVPLDLFPTLRVSNVESDKGAPLDYVQEKKEEDSDFGVGFSLTRSKKEKPLPSKSPTAAKTSSSTKAATTTTPSLAKTGIPTRPRVSGITPRTR